MKAFFFYTFKNKLELPKSAVDLLHLVIKEGCFLGWNDFTRIWVKDVELTNLFIKQS